MVDVVNVYRRQSVLSYKINKKFLTIKVVCWTIKEKENELKTVNKELRGVRPNPTLRTREEICYCTRFSQTVRLPASMVSTLRSVCVCWT